MRLSQAGEGRAIETIRKRFYHPVPDLLRGIGEDTAVLRAASSRSGRRDLLLTTDVLVEGIDFDLRHGSFHQVGFKAVAANLSDIASMGGIPRFFLTTLGLPDTLELAQLEELYEGMDDLAREYRMRLIGGDLSSTRGPLFVSLTVLGEAEHGRAVFRSGAKVGDWVFVTGSLGDSSAGLEMAKTLRRSSKRSGDLTGLLPLLQRHFYPLPRIAEGRTFSAQDLASAMIDLSDGLASDLRHLCEESRVGAEVETTALPLSQSLLRYAKKVGRPPWDYALTGGEDFELLLTVSPSRLGGLEKVARQKKWGLTRIGRILPRSCGIRLRDGAGRLRPMTARGYEHFKERYEKKA